MLSELGDGSMETSSRDISASVTKARVAVQKSMVTVTPAVTMVRLTGGVSVAIAPMLLSCGVTTVPMGYAHRVQCGHAAMAGRDLHSRSEGLDTATLRLKPAAGPVNVLP